MEPEIAGEESLKVNSSFCRLFFPTRISHPSLERKRAGRPPGDRRERPGSRRPLAKPAFLHLFFHSQ